jgi:hypothetical protein
MQNELNGRDGTRHGKLEYRKGCPACEHSDPDLDREFRAFAQLLLDIYLAKREKGQKADSDAGIDNRH